MTGSPYHRSHVDRPAASLRSAPTPHRARWTRRHVLLGAAGIGTLSTGGFWSTRGTQVRPLLAAGTPGAAVDDELRVATSGWKTDFTKHSVPLGEIISGGVPRDGIPPIDAPQYVAIAEADGWLEAREPVIAVVGEGRAGPVARAYPLQIMVWHEIVNDVLADRPTLVTFCPLCNTAIAFDRRLDPDGLIYDFGTTGNLRFSDLVMWDRQTESWWQQLSGEAIVGALTGRRLTPVPAQILGWEAFKAAYPAGNVLSRETGHFRPYGDNPYPGYDDIDSTPFLFEGNLDGRLAPMERVVGLAVGDEAVAYAFPALAGHRAVNERVGGQEVVVLYAPGARSALDAATIAGSRDTGQAGVFHRRLDDRLLTFHPDGNDHFVDLETGTIWDVTGRGVDGVLTGRTLAPVPHTVVFWFAWAAAYPNTRLWTASDA